jgi:hypothetical protein
MAAEEECGRVHHLSKTVADRGSNVIFTFLYAASVAGAFIGWYACGPIKSRSVRCVARAGVIAFLCAPGVLVGHGVGVAPSLFGLVAQPPFTLISIAITWVIALALVFGIPALRRHQNRWPPSMQEFFIDGYIGKFLLFGVIYAMVLVAVLYADDTYYYVMQGISYALFFAGAAINFLLCFRAVKSRNANPFLVPVLFAAPIFFGAAPTVSLLWYGGGAVGSLVALRRHRLAAQISAIVLLLLAANSLLRSYRAIDAAAHVSIEGGVVGNAAIAALFVALAIALWWALTRRDR